jgi:hypothetical protein
MAPTDNTVARTLTTSAGRLIRRLADGAAGLNGAAAVVEDLTQRLRVANTGWARWTPLNLAGIAAHLAIVAPERVAWLADRCGCGSTPPPDRHPRSALETPLLSRPHRAGYLMRLTAFDQRRPGALLSSDDFGSSVERTAKLHPLWQVQCVDAAGAT